MSIRRDQLDNLLAGSETSTGEILTISLGSREIQKLLDDTLRPDAN